MFGENININNRVADFYNFPRYSNAKQEKCEDVFVKTCRIVQRPKTYNHTVRLCRRPLVKKCHEYQESVSVGSHDSMTQYDMLSCFQLPVYGGGYAAPPGYGAPPPSYGLYGAPPPPVYHAHEPGNVVCRDMYETVCNTSALVGDDARERGLPVTQCGQVKKGSVSSVI